MTNVRAPLAPTANEITQIIIFKQVSRMVWKLYMLMPSLNIPRIFLVYSYELATSKCIAFETASQFKYSYVLCKWKALNTLYKLERQMKCTENLTMTRRKANHYVIPKIFLFFTNISTGYQRSQLMPASIFHFVVYSNVRLCCQF